MMVRVEVVMVIVVFPMMVLALMMMTVIPVVPWQEDHMIISARTASHGTILYVVMPRATAGRDLATEGADLTALLRAEATLRVADDVSQVVLLFESDLAYTNFEAAERNRKQTDYLGERWNCPVDCNPGAWCSSRGCCSHSTH